MRWKNQSGVTLVELLAAIAIMSIVIVPILTLTHNSSTRTAVQGKESQLIYFAQEVLEEIKSGNRAAANDSGHCTTSVGCSSSVTEAESMAWYTVSITPFNNPYGGVSQFDQVHVTVSSVDVVTNPVEIVTVIRR